MSLMNPALSTSVDDFVVGQYRILHLTMVSLWAKVRMCRANNPIIMADRRAGRGPYVPETGGGKQPRSRTKGGRWREKRSDAGTKRKQR